MNLPLICWRIFKRNDIGIHSLVSIIKCTPTRWLARKTSVFLSLTDQPSLVNTLPTVPSAFEAIHEFLKLHYFSPLLDTRLSRCIIFSGDFFSFGSVPGSSGDLDFPDSFSTERQRQEM